MQPPPSPQSCSPAPRGCLTESRLVGDQNPGQAQQPPLGSADGNRRAVTHRQSRKLGGQRRWRARQARLRALPPRLLLPPEGPPTPPQPCSCRGRGSGARGGRGLAHPTSPPPPGRGWGAQAEQRGNREVGLPEHLWCWAPAQPPPGSVDSVTQALTGGQKWPHVLGRPCRPLPQEARARERWTRSQQAEGWGAELLGGRTGGGKRVGSK